MYSIGKTSNFAALLSLEPRRDPVCWKARARMTVETLRSVWK